MHQRISAPRPTDDTCHNAGGHAGTRRRYAEAEAELVGCHASHIAHRAEGIFIAADELSGGNSAELRPSCTR